MEKLISIGNLSYFKTLMDNKNNEKFGVAELPISSDGKVDLTQIRTDATPGKLYKVTDPNNKREGNLYFGTHAITFVASRMFTPGSNVSVQPGTIILSTGQYGLIYVFPMSTSAIYQLDISTKEDYYQAWVYDVTENYVYNKIYHTMPQSEIITPTARTAFTQDSTARSFTATGASNTTYENVITLSEDVNNIVINSTAELVGMSGPADQAAKISITDTSNKTTDIFTRTNYGTDLIQTGPMKSGSKLTLTYVSGTYDPEGATQTFILEYYTKETTSSELEAFISSLVTTETTERRQADLQIYRNMSSDLSDINSQLYKLQGSVLMMEDQALNMSISNLDNNSDYRFFGPSNSGVTILGFTFEGLSLGTADDFKFQATFQTASSGCTFSLTETDSIKIKLTGDDVTNGVLNPVANKVYEIAFYWNGLFMSGVVRGIEHEASAVPNKISITNSGTVNDINIYQNYDESNIEFSNLLYTVSAGETKDLYISGSTVYANLSYNSASTNNSLEATSTSNVNADYIMDTSKVSPTAILSMMKLELKGTQGSVTLNPKYDSSVQE